MPRYRWRTSAALRCEVARGLDSYHALAGLLLAGAAVLALAGAGCRPAPDNLASGFDSAGNGGTGAAGAGANAGGGSAAGIGVLVGQDGLAGSGGAGGIGSATDSGAPGHGNEAAGHGSAAGGGMSGASGHGGTGGSSGAGGPPCLTKGSQVILVGDSYINWISHTFPADLNREAGQTFRLYAVGGFSMGSGGIGLIPPEFDQAVAADPDIKTMVLDGGGNDVLIPSAIYANGAQCKNSMSSPTIADCQTIIRTALDAAIRLMDTAASKGVKDVIYFFYPHVPEGTLIGGSYPNAILDYALPMVKDLCDTARVRTDGKLTCHFVDLIPIFEGHPDWFAATDIHPNSMGSAAMAKAVWTTMKDACVAQPASSGCCTP
jgi:hypothetical protein